MSLKPMSFVRVRMALVLLSLAGAACSDDLRSRRRTGADIPMTTVPSPRPGRRNGSEQLDPPDSDADGTSRTGGRQGQRHHLRDWRVGRGRPPEGRGLRSQHQHLVPWTPRAPLPAARQLPNGAAVINGKIYVAGGLTPLGPTRSLYVYNVASNSWTTKASMPIRSHGGAAAAIDGKLWVIATPAGEGGFYTDRDAAVSLRPGHRYLERARAGAASSPPRRGRGHQREDLRRGRDDEDAPQRSHLRV